MADPARSLSLLPDSPGHERVLIAPAAESHLPFETAQQAASALRLEVEVGPPGSGVERLAYFLHPDDWSIDVPVELVFSDHRRVQGVLWPHRVEVFMGPRKVGEYLFTEVRFNRPLDEALFG